MSRFAEVFAAICLAFSLAQGAHAAVYTVTKTTDSNDGACNTDCSLREAVAAANNSPDNDAIEFSPEFLGAFQTLTLSLGGIVISNNGSLTINGPGSDRLEIVGVFPSRPLTIHTATVNIHGLTFRNGSGNSPIDTGRGGLIYNFGGTTLITDSVITRGGASFGGGLANAPSTVPGDLTLINCVVTRNQANQVGGGIQNFPNAKLTIVNSAITRNQSAKASVAGGGLQAGGTVHISNTTFSGNSAADGSGGAILYNGTALILNNVTIAENASVDGSGGLQQSSALSPAIIRNSLFANNTSGSTSGPDALGSFNSQGNNFIQTAGFSSGWIASDIRNQPALTVPEGTYGGKGESVPLLPNSPAVNAGNNCVMDLSCAFANPPSAIIADQRGAMRQPGAIDIGSFEVSEGYVAHLANAQTGVQYSASIVTNAGPFTYSLTGGMLPPGLNFIITEILSGRAAAVAPEFATVSIRGTPTQQGAFDFGITAANAANSTVFNYRITVGTASPNANIRGRITSSNGRPVSNAIVILDNRMGTTYSARSNPFGYFSFVNVATGATYHARASAKRQRFSPQTVTAVGDISDLNFTGTP